MNEVSFNPQVADWLMQRTVDPSHVGSNPTLWTTVNLIIKKDGKESYCCGWC